MIKKILVIGGTGMLGKPVVNQLLKDNFQVKVFTRSKQKARDIFGEKVDVATGIIEDAETIKKAMEGCQAVHLNLDTNSETIGAVNAAAAGKEAGMERVSCISGSTVSEETRWHPYINTKYLAEQAIIKSGIDYHIFCPTWFMESLPLMVRKGKAFVIGKQPNQFHWVAAADYAKMVSKAYQIDESKNKRFIVHGPQGMTMHQAMQEYIENLHPEIKKVSTMPVGMAKFMGFITGQKALRQVASLYAYFEKTPEKGNPSEANKLLGKPKTQLKEWMKEK
jgi:uncharacterized protein YbjT (DUF2867 family)